MTEVAKVVFKTAFDGTAFKKGIESMGAGLDEMRQSLTNVANATVKAFDKAEKSLNCVAGATENAFGSKQQSKIETLSQKLARQKENIEKQTAALEDMRAQYDALLTGETKPKALIELEKEAAKAETELDRLQKSFTRLIEQEEKLKAKGTIKNQEALRDLNYEIEKVGNSMTEAQGKVDSFANKVRNFKFDPDSEEAQELVNKIEFAGKRLNRLTNEANITEQNLERVFRSASDEAAKADTQIEQVFDTEPVNRFGKAVRGIASTFGKIPPTLGKFGKAVLGLAARFKLLNKHTKQSENSLSRMAVRIRSLVAAAFVFNVIRRGLSELRNYMGSLLKTNAEFVASLRAIKVNLMTAFQPIFDAVLPMLNALVSALATATAYLAAFISMLSGKTYSQSKAAAKALNQQAAAMKKVGSAAKEAEGELASFDQINKQSANGSAGGGMSAAEIGELFDEVSNPDINYAWLDEFKEKLLDIVPDLEYFTELGKSIAKKITDGLNKIPWATIQAHASSVAQKLASFLNGFLVNPDLWVALGYTLAQGLNTAVLFAYDFLTSFDFMGFGAAIAAGINKFFETFNWTKFGETVAAWVMMIFKTMYGLFSDIDWSAIGLKIAEGLTAITENIDWVLIGAALALGINGLLDSILTFLTSYDWLKLGRQMTQSLNELLNKVDWLELGATLGALFVALFDLLIGAVQEFDWGGLVIALFLFLVGFIEHVNWADLGKKLSDAVMNLLQSIKTAIQTVDWFAFGKLLYTSIKDLITNIDWDGIASELSSLIGTMIGALVLFLKGLFDGVFRSISDYFEKSTTEMGGNAVLGFWNGIIKALGNIAKWLKDNIVDPFLNSFRKMFGIHSPSTVMAGLGANIMEGLLNGIKSRVEAVKDIFKSIISFIKGVFAMDWEKAWGGIKDIFKGIFNSIIIILESAMNLIVKGFNGLIGKLNTIKFDVPDWVPSIGGKQFGFGLSKLTEFSIPRLAQGGLIQPNYPRLVMVGDNTKEPEIVSPVSTMKQAFIEAMAELGGVGGVPQSMTVVLQVDRRELGSVIVELGNDAVQHRGVRIQPRILPGGAF